MPKEVIAVDLGGTNLRVSKFKGNKVFEYAELKTAKTKLGILSQLTNSISKLINKNSAGIGICVAAATEEGIIKKAPNLPLQNFNIKTFLQRKFKKRIEVENDANCVALAEAKFGIKKKNFIVLTLGTGIGGGIIIDNKLYRGKGLAAELGHIIIHAGKDLEYYAGGKAIAKLSKKYCGKEYEIAELIKRKDAASRRVLNEIADYLGQGIASLIAVFDPEVVVLAGGVREAGAGFLKMVEKRVRKYTFIPRKPPIIWSKIKHPGILGASLLID